MTDPPPDRGIPELLTLKEVANMLGVSRQYTYRLVMRGDIRGRKAGEYWVFRRSIIEKYLTAHREPASVQ
jgi:excisionase family DNA binding protein